MKKKPKVVDENNFVILVYNDILFELDYRIKKLLKHEKSPARNEAFINMVMNVSNIFNEMKHLVEGKKLTGSKKDFEIISELTILFYEHPNPGIGKFCSQTGEFVWASQYIDEIQNQIESIVNLVA